MSKEDITLTQKLLHCMFERTLGVQNMHTIEIAYVNENDVKSNIYKYYSTVAPRQLFEEQGFSNGRKTVNGKYQCWACRGFGEAASVRCY